MSDIRLAVRIERLEAMRMLLGKFFDSVCRTAIRVAFTQYRVDGGTEACGITRLNLFFRIRLRIFRIIRQVVSLCLKLGDTLFELRDGS